MERDTEHIDEGILPKGCKACIALTSWKARINTVGLTIFNLWTTCGPEFHIVLTLAEEEFPKKEAELPADLMRMNRFGIFEILWVKKNYKSFKKVLFAMERYKTVPIISADDDCIYRYNYAEELYTHWLQHKHARICYWCSDILGNKQAMNTSGYGTLHPPYFYKRCIQLLTDEIISLAEDDLFYAAKSMILHKSKVICLNKAYSDVVISHDELNPLHKLYRTKSGHQRFIDMLTSIGNRIAE